MLLKFIKIYLKINLQWKKKLLINSQYQYPNHSKGHEYHQIRPIISFPEFLPIFMPNKRNKVLLSAIRILKMILTNYESDIK